MTQYLKPSKTSDRTRLVFLVVIMAAVAVAVTSFAIATLYQASLEQERLHLASAAKSQARLIEAMARFGEHHGDEAETETLKQISEAFAKYQGFGNTGEFVVARRDGDQIFFIFSRHRLGLGDERTVPWGGSELAAPMRLALSGQSGTIIAADYADVEVLAAYEGIAEFDLGLVAKIDMSEIRQPFISAAIVSAAGGFIIILLAAFLFRRISAPILERQAAEAALRASESRLSGILDIAVEAIISVGVDQRIRLFNKGAEAIFGYSASEVMGQPLGILLPERFRNDHRQHLRTFKAGSEPRRMMASRSEINGLRKDGTEFPAEASITVIEVDGEPAFTATLVDLTNRKAAEAAVLREKAQAEEYLNVAGSMIMALDEVGNITLMNDAARKALEHDDEEVIGKGWIKTFVPKDEREERYKWYLEWIAEGDQDTEQRVVNVITKTGKSLTTMWNNRIIRDDNGKAIGALCSGEDITELRHTELQLRQAQKMEAVGQLTSGIAHDFNNILAVIMGNLEMAVEGNEAGKPIDRQLALAQEAGQRGADLNRQLLAFSKNQMFEARVIDVNGVIEGMTGILERAMGATIAISSDLQASLPATAADPAQLESAILNIAINARDAMPDGGLLSIKTSTETAPEGLDATEMIRISISDTGKGMPAEIRERALEPFFTTKATDKGSGLGLSMVYNFVNQSAGTIEISGAEGEGTRLDILLPVADAEAVPDAPVNAHGTTAPTGEHCILVVEDQDEVREIVAENLKSLGYQIVEASNGEEALELVKRRTDLDLVISDMVMPGMSGQEVISAVQRHRPEIKCLFMSGFPEAGSSDGSAVSTDIPILRKPFTKAVLAQAVQDRLNPLAKT